MVEVVFYGSFYTNVEILLEHGEEKMMDINILEYGIIMVGYLCALGFGLAAGYHYGKKDRRC